MEKTPRNGYLSINLGNKNMTEEKKWNNCTWSVSNGIWTVAPEENCPQLGLGLVLELGTIFLGGNCPRIVSNTLSEKKQ